MTEIVTRDAEKKWKIHEKVGSTCPFFDMIWNEGGWWFGKHQTDVQFYGSEVWRDLDYGERQ